MLVFALYLMLWWAGLPCLLKYFTDLPCPGCGMSRALLTLLRGDLAAAWYWHPMVYSLPVLALLVWQDGQIFFKNVLNMALCLFLLAGFAVSYVIRLLGGLAPV